MNETTMNQTLTDLTKILQIDGFNAEDFYSITVTTHGEISLQGYLTFEKARRYESKFGFEFNYKNESLKGVQKIRESIVRIIFVIK